MKKLRYIIAISAIFAVSSCDDYLDTDNLSEKSLDSFYKSPTDIDEAMAGVYNAIYTPNVHSEEQVAANLMDNMMFGGGGPDDKSAKWVDNFEDPAEDTYRDMWKQSYNGISRANAIIEKVPKADFSKYFNTPQEAEDFKKQALGEALFMRAFFYFRLAKFFGGVPMIITYDADRLVPRATYEETFAQIASDLKLAIETLPSTPFTSIPTSRYGHANKWVAEAYLGRVFLFYTGYMSNIEKKATTDLPLAGGGALTGAQVASYLDDCINNSGHKLASDFRNLWPYSYVNKSAKSNSVLPWAAAEGLSWVGQDGVTPTFGTGNLESMFVQRYSFGNWDWTNGQSYTNRLALFNSLRGNSLAPFGEGWGWCTVSPKLYSGWDDADPRKRGSILEVGKADQGTDGYAADKGDHETGYFNKKYVALQHDNGKGSYVGMFVQMYAWSITDMQLMHAQDFIFMRFADVLLMHSEITKTADGMNAVRGRAHLGPVAYSLDNIKTERLHELAFEGLHWFDLVRWGDVETAFNDVTQVRNSGVDANYSVKYRTETKGLVPIPETEIRLLNGVYNQNPGW
ncbi:SusD family protein [compost metagenome]|jgi:hypothetical protein